MDAASSNDVLGLCQAARQHLQDGSVDAAVDELRRAAGLDPDNADAYGLLGIAYTRLGDAEAGLRAFERAVYLDPRSADRRYNHAIALEKAGKTEAAVDVLTEGLRIQSTHVKIREALGRLRADRLAAPVFDLPTSKAPPPPPSEVRPGGFVSAAPQAAPPPPPPPAPAYGQQAYAPQPQAGGPPSVYGQQAAYAPQPLAGQPSVYSQPPAYGQQPPPYGQQPVYGARYGSATASAFGGSPDPGFWSAEHVMQILTEPSSFMAEQRGRIGLWPPIAFLMVHCALLVLVVGLIVFTRTAASPPAGSNLNMGLFAVGYIIGLAIGGVIGIPIAIGLSFAGAGIFHLMVMMFRGQGEFAGTFRAFVYAGVPFALCNVLSTGLSAMSESLAIAGLVVQLVGTLWALWVLAVGLSEVHDLSIGAGAAAAFIPGVVMTGVIALLLLPVFMAARSRAALGGSPFPTGSTFGQPSSGFGGPTLGGPSSSGFGGPTFRAPGGMSPQTLPQAQPPGFVRPTFPTGPSGPSMMGPRRMGPMGPGMGSRFGPTGPSMGSRFGPMGGPSMGGRMGPMGPHGIGQMGGPPGMPSGP